MALAEQAEPLLPRQQQNCPPPDEAAGRRCRSVTTWITALGFVLCTFNCVVAVHYSQGHSVAVCSLCELLALFVCLNRYEKAEPGSELRDRQKLSARLLMMVLAFLFSCQVSIVVPPAVAIGVSLMAIGTVAGGLYYYF